MEDIDLGNVEVAKSDKLGAAIFIATIILVILVIAMGVIVITHIKEIREDPLIYGLEKHNYHGCVCYDEEGMRWEQTEQGFKRIQFG